MERTGLAGIAAGVWLAAWVTAGAAGCSGDALAEGHADAGGREAREQRSQPARDDLRIAARPGVDAVRPVDMPTSTATRAEGVCPEGSVLVHGGRLVHLEHTADVDVADFCLDVREVSVGEYRARVERGACERECDDPKSCPTVPVRTDWGSSTEDDNISRLCNGLATGVEDHPVNCVSPGEAHSYCASRGMRLPGGDEWEWAARGSRISPWGTPVAVSEICWGRPKKRAGTCVRGTFDKDVTPEGIFDLGGNLTEWTDPPARSGKGARFAYGASWYARDDGYAIAALGGVGMPARRAETVGFRCAATPRP